MSDGSEVDGLLEWLETSGRALELRVIRAFRQTAQVRHSVYYEDSESGKSREADVIARFHGTSRSGGRSQLDVVVECKTGKPGSQWVAFRDGSRPSHFYPNEDLWLTATKLGVKSRFEDAWEWRPPLTDRVNASSIVTAHDGRDSAHDAVQQLVSALGGQAEFVRRNDVRQEQTFDEAAGQSFTWSEPEAGVLGLVVTTLPIYVAELGEGETLRVEPVDLVAVPTGRPQPAGPTRVFVAREAALPRIVAELQRTAERL